MAPTNQPSPPLAVQRITKEEIEVVRNTSKNVYVPHMHNLIIGPKSFTSNQFGNVVLLEPQMDLADFTLQAVLEWDVKNMEKIDFDDHLGLVFRLNSQTGKGYTFMWRLCSQYFKKVYLQTWGVYMIHTRSQLTGEPLMKPNYDGYFLGSEKKSNPVMVTIVAQGNTLDFYANLEHLGRIENATISRGKLAFDWMVPGTDYHCPIAVKDLKVWIP